MAARLRVGVLYGGRSGEHQVSVVSAASIISALDREKYEVVPIGITTEGRWLPGVSPTALIETGQPQVRALPGMGSGSPAADALMAGTAQDGRLLAGLEECLDVVFPVLHGPYGEDGTVQGLLELACVPYVGAGVLASAVGMDKGLMKSVFRQAGLPVPDYLVLLRKEWESAPETVRRRVQEEIGYPCFVKPANLGSSVGISKALSRADLKGALEVAAAYDRRLLVEEGVPNLMEINCSVLGNDDPIPSVCEQPLAWQDFLSYEDKYLRGDKSQGMKGASRRIPAPISQELTRRIQELAVAAFRAVDCAGIARVDVLVDEATEETYVNEINTIPGSLSFYLWEPSGVSFTELTDRLIQLALERHAEKARTHYSYDSTIIQKVAAGAKTGRALKG